jgi:hypothetical protein
MIACPFKASFGIDCPGCGFQRSLESLLEGDFIQSFLFYPASIPILLFFGFALLHIVFKFKNGLKYVHLFFYGNLIIIGVNYAIRCFQGSIV